MNEERCRVSDETLVAYDDRYLSIDQERDLDLHVQGCRHCTSRLHEFREVERLIRAWAPPLTTSDHWPAMRDRIEAREAGQHGARQTSGGITAALALMMIVIALISPIGTWIGLPPLGSFRQFGGAPDPEQSDERLEIPAPTMNAVGQPRAVTIVAFDIGWKNQGDTAVPAQPFSVSTTPGAAISLTNVGEIPHSFSIDALAIAKNIPPGVTVMVSIPNDAPPGTYSFYCNLPGHRQAGMVGTLLIE